jgi:hypothetical protein
MTTFGALSFIDRRSVTISHAIEPTARRVTIRVDGPTSYQDWEDSIRAVLADPQFQPGFDFLSDRRSADPPPTIDMVRRAVGFFELNRRQFGTCRWALVVSGPAAYGMGRMAEALAAETGVRVKVFTQMAAADQWLRHPG